MQRTSASGRIWRRAGVTLAVSWICVLVFVQWLLLMTPSALRVETRTGLRLVDLSHWLRAQVAKPLSPPQQ
jgi:hypothetical protein